MSKMEIGDLSPEEKIRFEEFKNLEKEGADFYWRVAILLFFFWQIIDIILTITFSPFGGRGFGCLPNIPFNMNNFVQLWCQLPVFFLVFGFFASWMGVKRAKKKKLAAALIILLWAAYFTYMISIEPWITDALPRQIVGVAEFLGFLGITIFLAIKVKWSRFIWVVAAYLGVLLTLYYGFYRPITLVLEYSPGPPPFSILSSNIIQYIILPVVGIISAIFMAWACSEKGRRWVAFGDILEERKKKRK